jgi:hypothetical protein
MYYRVFYTELIIFCTSPHRNFDVDAPLLKLLYSLENTGRLLPAKEREREKKD